MLLRPLVNRDEDRLIYISQTARGGRLGNAKFSVPEIRDLRGAVKSLSALGEFSTIDFTLLGLGEPRVVAPASSADRISRSWGCARCGAG